MIELLETHSVIFLLALGIIGAMIGSFLNVVIYRLPRMLQQEWETECRSFLTLPVEKCQPSKKYNLFVPRSHCLHCNQQINVIDNIPILSYIFLGGKCRHCKHTISARYPLIELSALGLSLLVGLQFGLTWQAIFALIFVWSLLALIVIDIDHQLLPDTITLPLLWLGLLINLNNIFIPLPDAILGAVTGYLSLWSFTKLYYLLTGKHGMGHGDFKLLAALGAWLGWQMLPLIVIFSSLVGAIVGISLVIFTHRERDKPIPFGPYLAIAGMIALGWGSQINSLYLRILN